MFYSEYSSAVIPSTAVWNEGVGRQLAQPIDDNLLRILRLDRSDIQSDSAGRLAPTRDPSPPRITGPVNHLTPFCPDLEL